MKLLLLALFCLICTTGSHAEPPIFVVTRYEGDPSSNPRTTKCLEIFASHRVFKDYDLDRMFDALKKWPMAAREKTAAEKKEGRFDIYMYKGVVDEVTPPKRDGSYRTHYLWDRIVIQSNVQPTFIVEQTEKEGVAIIRLIRKICAEEGFL